MLRPLSRGFVSLHKVLNPHLELFVAQPPAQSATLIDRPQMSIDLYLQRAPRLLSDQVRCLLPTVECAQVSEDAFAGS
jgi:hypothetical protein